MNKTVLITGGAGYIGSHISWLLAQHGYKIIVIDNLCYQQQYYAPWATFIKDDFADAHTLSEIFSQHAIDAVIHCAAFIEVNASVKDPRIYYENNLSKTGKLLELMLQHNVKKFIFSSSCAAYGAPITNSIAEDHPCNPISPYGNTKFMVERILADFDRAYDLKYINMRYFNVAGAEPDYDLGEQHVPETHLIPLLLHAMHHQKPFTIFGDDYDTPDGSCLRDFVHVTDIARAHLFALHYLDTHQPSETFNIGSGQGVSIKQLIKTAEQLFNTKIQVVTSNRRQGDPARLIANITKAEHMLQWKPQQSHIEHILKSAYAFMMKHQEMIPKMQQSHPYFAMK